MTSQEDAVTDILGQEAWDLLLDSVDRYILTGKHQDEIANLLKVGGQHERRKDDEGAKSDIKEWRKILSDWYGLPIGLKPLKGMKRKAALMELVRILGHKNVQLHPLAKDLKNIAEKAEETTVGPVSSNILPDVQNLDKVLPGWSAPGIPATLSDQGINPTCSSHAVGKAVQDFLDKNSFHTDQDEVIKTLQNLVPCGATTAKHPDEFSGKPFTVTDIKDGRTIKVEVLTESRHRIEALTGRDTQNFAHAAAPMVIFTAQEYETIKQYSLGLVLVWNLGKDGTHAIYAKSFNPATNVFSCINSWKHPGTKKPYLPEPEIHISRIEAIYCVQLKEVY